jgi:hypothetical protein
MYIKRNKQTITMWKSTKLGRRTVDPVLELHHCSSVNILWYPFFVERDPNSEKRIENAQSRADFVSLMQISKIGELKQWRGDSGAQDGNALVSKRVRKIFRTFESQHKCLFLRESWKNEASLTVCLNRWVARTQSLKDYLHYLCTDKDLIRQLGFLQTLSEQWHARNSAVIIVQKIETFFKAWLRCWGSRERNKG